MSPTITKPKKKATKPGEAQRKQAIAETEQRIAAIDAAERGEAPAATAEATPQAKPDAKGRKAKGAKAPKPAKAVEAPREKKPKRMGGLDAAAQVLKDAGAPMTAKAMMEVISQKKLWTTTGRTPQATIYAAIIREIAAKGSKARFTKPAPGQFAFNKKAG